MSFNSRREYISTLINEYKLRLKKVPPKAQSHEPGRPGSDLVFWQLPDRLFKELISPFTKFKK